MKKAFLIILLLSVTCILYAQNQTERHRQLEAYNQTHIYNWSSIYPEYELKYLLNETETPEENLTYEEKQKKEIDQWYKEHYANKTTYNVPGSEVNPLKYNWYYRSNYTPTYNPMSGNFTYEPQGANLTYNPYTQKWEYKE